MIHNVRKAKKINTFILKRIVINKDIYMYIYALHHVLSVSFFFSFVLIDLDNLPVAIKKSCECPKIPIVPGPVISLSTLTIANVPLIKPKPYPEA